MKISLENALGQHPAALQLRAQRTSVLSNNIANADTPGYKAKDMDFHAVLAQQTQTSSARFVRATNARHIGGTHGGDVTFDALQYRVPAMPSLDGNSVDIQMEQAAFAENSLQFLTSLRVLNGRLQGLMTAIKGE